MKTLVFLNLRFANFYSHDLFKKSKEKERLRIVVILDQQFNDRIPDNLLPFIDQIYFVEARKKNGFLAEFDVEELRPILTQELAKDAQLRIICSDEFNLLNAGMLRREYGLQGHTDNELLVYRDKVRMKSVLEEQGIRVPRFKLLNQADDFVSLKESIQLPFIIKPRDSCGSHGVYKIESHDDYLEFLKNNSVVDEIFEVEEFIQGKLYHVDSWVRDGNIQFICANEYTFPNHEYTKGKVLGSIALNSDDLLGQRLIEFAKRSLCALKANNLVNHMELFVTSNDEIIFLEVSARPPGALVNLAHRINYGINLMDEDFFMQAGIQAIDLNNKVGAEKAFWVLFPLIPGKVGKLNFPVVNSRIQMDWFVKRGDEIAVEACQNIVGKAAQAIFFHVDSDVLRKDFEYIKSHQALEMMTVMN